MSALILSIFLFHLTPVLWRKKLQTFSLLMSGWINSVLSIDLKDSIAMYSNPKTGLLNVISDADNIFVKLKLMRKMVKEYAFPKNNQGGITLDEEVYLFISQDIGRIIRVKDLR